MSVPHLLFTLGGVLAATLLVAILGAWAWGRLWAYIDDAKRPDRNPVVALVLRATGCGWSWSPGWSGYSDKEGHYVPDGRVALLVFGAASILFFAPVIIYYAWQLVLFVVVAVILIKFARYSRRHKKVFDKHCTDKDAHKGD